MERLQYRWMSYLTYEELCEIRRELEARFKNKDTMSQSELLDLCRQHRETHKLILDAEIDDEASTVKVYLTEDDVALLNGQ